jgi:hypothetical protein
MRYLKIEFFTASIKKNLLIRQILPKAITESMSQLTAFAVRTLLGFTKPLVYCESGF